VPIIFFSGPILYIFGRILFWSSLLGIVMTINTYSENYFTDKRNPEFLDLYKYNIMYSFDVTCKDRLRRKNRYAVLEKWLSPLSIRGSTSIFGKREGLEVFGVYFVCLCA